MAVKAIVFDLWNTLSYNEGMNPAVAIMEEFNITDIKILEESFMKKKFPSINEAMSNLCRHAGIEPNKKNLQRMQEIWMNSGIKTKIFEDVIPVLKELKREYKLGLISNTDCYYLDFFKDLFMMFDSVSLSCDVGLLKPDPEIFKLIVNRLGVKPEEAIMIGDNLKDDVEGAKSIGMEAILIKRELDYQKSWTEKQVYERTIKDLYALKDYLKNG